MFEDYFDYVQEYRIQIFLFYKKKKKKSVKMLKHEYWIVCGNVFKQFFWGIHLSVYYVLKCLQML